MVILGYKYLTEEEALEDSDRLNTYYGIPTSEFAETIRVVDIVYGLDEEEQGFWYIQYYPPCKPVLGDPIEFSILDTQERKINA